MTRKSKNCLYKGGVFLVSSTLGKSVFPRVLDSSHSTYPHTHTTFPRVLDGALQHTNMILYIIYMCVHISVSVCRTPSEMCENVACTVVYICIKSAQCRVNLYSHASWTAV